MRRTIAVAALAVIAAAVWLSLRPQDGERPVPPRTRSVAQATSDATSPPAVPPRTRGTQSASEVPSGEAPEPEPPAIHPLRGTVRSWDGQPLARAVVHAAPLPLLPRAPDPRRPRDATCDAGGVFELPPLSEGDWMLTIDFDGAVGVFAGTVGVPGVAALDLVLPRGGVVEGVAIDDESREPLPNARVRLRSYGITVADAVASPTGRFRMAHFGRAASSSFRVDAPGFEREAVSEEFDETLLGRQEVAVVVRRGGVLRGVVRSPEGPVAAAAVRVFDSWFARDAEDVWTATTGADGRFQVEGLPRDGGTLLVEAVAAGFLMQEEPHPDVVDVEESGDPYERVDLDETRDGPVVIAMRRRGAPGTCEVSGRVIDEEGNPAAGIVVRCVQPRGSVSATSGPDGAYELHGIAAESVEQDVRVVCERSGVRSGDRRFAVRAGERVEEVDVELSDQDEASDVRPVLRGRVTADGTPVAEARVFVYAFEWEAHLRCFGGPRRPPSAILLRTAADGSFDVEVGSGDSVAVVVAVEGFATWRRLLDRAGLEQPCEVRLVRPVPLSGRVVRTGTTTGVAGVWVVIARNDPQDADEDDRVSLAYDTRVAAITAADGSFRVASIDLDRESLRFVAPGWLADEWTYDEDDAAFDASELVIAMRPEPTMRGRVEFEDGRPAAGVRLAVGGPDDRLSTWWDGDPPQADDPLNDPSETIETAADGSFRVDLPDVPGVRVLLYGGTPPVQRVFVDAGGADERRIVVTSGKSIRGRVTRPDGSAAAYVVVRARPEGDADGISVAAATGRDGTFAIDGLGDGPHEMTCGARGAFRWNRRGVVPGAEEVEVALDEGLAIAGVVRDADGNGLRGRSFTVVPTLAIAKPPASVIRAQCDHDGRFRVATLTPGRWRIVFDDDVRIPPTEVTAGDASIVLTAAPAPSDDD